MTAPLDLDRLLELARAATPGPWQFDDGSIRTVTHAPGDCTRGNVVSGGSVGYENASLCADDDDLTFIAAASPDVIIALVERLRAAETGYSAQIVASALRAEAAEKALAEIRATWRDPSSWEEIDSNPGEEP